MMEVQRRRIEVILPGDTENELVDDFVAVITSMCARIYGRRNAKRRAQKIKKCIEQSEETN
jgi:putative resolvase